eukprot:GHRQ01013010.1.p1 GENE.GHRQ01013010.1~~GHRQ01013010.1.p1  ORF type:complete len:119 (-),score=4.84 GHRQ01013010.1:95-451(-)
MTHVCCLDSCKLSGNLQRQSKQHKTPHRSVDFEKMRITPAPKLARNRQCAKSTCLLTIQGTAASTLCSGAKQQQPLLRALAVHGTGPNLLVLCLDHEVPLVRHQLGHDCTPNPRHVLR